MRARVKLTLSLAAAAASLAVVAGCTAAPAGPKPVVTVIATTTVTAEPLPEPSPSVTPEPAPVVNPYERPDWMHGQEMTKDKKMGVGPPLPTPEELTDRQLEPRPAYLPDPESDEWFAEIGPVPAHALERSSWREECPVKVADLAYVVMPFWGFDNKPHTGEMLIAKRYAKKVVSVFKYMYQERFPIEEMYVTGDTKVNGPRLGDLNVTVGFECRSTTGPFTQWSQHAHGTAIDINPFHNPWRRDGFVSPEMATAYLDRTNVRRGMIESHPKIVKKFEAIGWYWGGEWTNLDDWMHFSHNNR